MGVDEIQCNLCMSNMESGRLKNPVYQVPKFFRSLRSVTSMNLPGNFDIFDDFQTVEIFCVKNFENIFYSIQVYRY